MQRYFKLFHIEQKILFIKEIQKAVTFFKELFLKKLYPYRTEICTTIHLNKDKWIYLYSGNILLKIKPI